MKYSHPNFPLEGKRRIDFKKKKKIHIPTEGNLVKRQDRAAKARHADIPCLNTKSVCQVQVIRPMALFMPSTPITIQEISLYCLIPNARHAQILRILSAICNMNPEPQLVHHLLYKPKRPKPPMMIGAGQQEMYHLQLIAKLDEAEFEEKRKEEEKERARGREDDVVMIDLDGGGSDGNGGNQQGEALYDIKKQRWTIQFLDFPDASPKPAETRRVIFQAEVGDGDALAFMEDFGYT